MGIGVRDLAQTQHELRTAWFQGQQGWTLSGGVSNSTVVLQNNRYLEMLAVSGEPPITKGDASEIGDFGKKREGAMFLGINVTSAEAAADYLKTHNFFSWSSTFPPIGGTKLALKSDGSSQHVHGHSRIPAEITHGMWTEMFQVEDQP